MNTAQPEKRKPLFSSIAVFCVMVSALLFQRTLSQINQGEAIAGYSGFNITVSFLVALTLTGLICGQIGLIRGEKPLALSLLALLLNGTVFIAAILVVPR